MKQAAQLRMAGLVTLAVESSAKVWKAIFLYDGVPEGVFTRHAPSFC